MPSAGQRDTVASSKGAYDYVCRYPAGSFLRLTAMTSAITSWRRFSSTKWIKLGENHFVCFDHSTISIRTTLTLILQKNLQYHSNYTANILKNMGYPDTFEGFMVSSHKNWSDFKKQEVGASSSIFL